MTILVCYDITNTRIRSKFIKLITKYGSRLQLSVFKLTLNPKTLDSLHCQISNFEFGSEYYSVVCLPIDERCVGNIFEIRSLDSNAKLEVF